LIERARSALGAHIRRRLGSHLRQEIESGDVFQETIAQALESIGGCRARDEKSFLRWLKSASEHVILNLARRQRSSRILYLEHDAPADDPTPSRRLRRDERWDRLQNALSGLRADRRKAVQLVRIEGLKIKEAAAEMGLSPRAVVHLVGRALEQLHSTLGETESLTLPRRRIDLDEGERHEP
jgi:RNA polymerase sigma factor (sigma-70 family)